MSKKKALLLYIAKRLGLCLISFLIIMTLCFFLIRLMPNNNAIGPGQDSAIYERLAHAYGWDKPIIIQYFLFWKNLFAPESYTNAQGVVETVSRFGYSFKLDYLASPLEMLGRKLPPTMIINVYSMLISVPLGILIGIFMAMKVNKMPDYILSVLVMVFISVPSFVYGFVIQYVFGFKLGLSPIVMPPLETGMTWFSPSIQQSMILPVLSLALPTIAGFARFTRAEMVEALSLPYMKLARMKGQSKFAAAFHHGFRNALVPLSPMIISQFVGILSGSIIIEKIFGIPGVGSLYLDSILQRDYDVFLFVSMFYTGIGLLASLVVDVSYSLIDPRIQMGGKKSNA